MDSMDKAPMLRFNYKFPIFDFRFSISVIVVLSVLSVVRSELVLSGEPAHEFKLPQPEHPIKRPTGFSQSAWEAYIKNDFAAADAAFREALRKEPGDLVALEGLRSTRMALG